MMKKETFTAVGDHGPAYTAAHEFGHAFEYFSGETGGTPGAYGDFCLVDHFDETNPWQLGTLDGFVGLFSKQKLKPISTYARKNKREKWAEAFASAICATPEEIKTVETRKQTVIKSMQTLLGVIKNNPIRKGNSMYGLSDSQRMNAEQQIRDLLKKIGIKAENHSGDKFDY